MKKRICFMILLALCVGVFGGFSQEAKPDRYYNVLFKHAKEVEARTENAVALVQNIPVAKVMGSRVEIDRDLSVVPTVQDGQAYLPLRFVCEAYGAKVEAKERVEITYRDKTYTLTEEGLTSGVETIPAQTKEVAGRLLISAGALAELLEKQLFLWAKRGVIVLSDTENLFTQEEETLLYELECQICYDRVLGERFISDLKANNPDLQHPRLLGRSERFEELRGQIETDQRLKQWVDSVVLQAEEVLKKKLSASPASTDWDGGRNTTNDMLTVGMAYQLTREDKYADYMKALLFWACGAGSWNPSHFLDVSEMAVGVALGYDWLYDRLSDVERKQVRDAIIKNAFTPAKEVYLADAEGAWPTRTTNWNMVTNGGLMVAAMAIGDEEPEVSGEIFEYAMRGLEFMLKKFYPDGGWHESATYWGYTDEFLTYAFAAMMTAMGTEYGYYYNTQDLKKTSYYPYYMTGYTAIFNFHDAAEGYMTNTRTFWHAAMTGDNLLVKLRMNEMEIRNLQAQAKDVLWYDAQRIAESEKLDFPPLDRYFDNSQTGSMRSSWTKQDGVYAAFHGGYNRAEHGQLDAGTFVLDAMGDRFISDMGGEDYNLPSFWSDGETGTRWDYYYNRAEGNNTIVVNPTAGADQRVIATATLDRKDFSETGGYVIYDMNEVHAPNTTSAKRGFMMFGNRDKLLVQDELTAKSGVDVWWYAHTLADITLSEDRKQAVLEIEGNKVIVTIQNGAPEQAVFRIMDAVPLGISPNPEGQKGPRGYRKLTIYLKDQKDLTLPVSFEAVREGEAVPRTRLQKTPLSEWKAPAGELVEIEYPSLAGISVDGNPISGFMPGVMKYKIDLPGHEGAEQVQVDNPKGYTVTTEIDKPSFGNIKVTVADKKGRKTIYKITYSVQPLIGPPENGNRLPVRSIKVSSEPQKENPAVAAIDGDMGTRWSSEGKEEWLQLTLDGVREVSAVTIGLMKGNERKQYFDLLLSEDGKKWTTVFSGNSSGKTLDMERFEFAPAKAKYVKMVCKGTSSSNWNSIQEINVYGTD